MVYLSLNCRKSNKRQKRCQFDVHKRQSQSWRMSNLHLSCFLLTFAETSPCRLRTAANNGRGPVWPRRARHASRGLSEGSERSAPKDKEQLYISMML